MTLKLDPTCSSFNPFPSLPSLATNERKQFQCLNIVLNNKTEQLFLEFSWSEGIFKLFKKIANSVTLHLSPGERENHNWKVALTRWLTTIPHWHSGQRASLDSSKMIRKLYKIPSSKKMNRWAAELMTEVLTQSFVKSKNEKTQLTLAYSSKVAFNWGKLRETRIILNLKLKHFTISSMQDKYINAWLRTSFFNDSIVFTLIKLTLIRLFPIWLPLLGTAPTYKLKKRIFDNSKLNMREDAFQSIAQC